jgi:hypothetical protein
MVNEDDGTLVIGGFGAQAGLPGDGLIRIDSITGAGTIVDVTIKNVRWTDLAVEANGDFVSTGFTNAEGAGVFRIDSVLGTHTVLNNTYDWGTLTGIGVGRDDGSIYVADAGICGDTGCTGGRIVRVDPVTGAATDLASGGFIQGKMDLLLVPEPGRMWLIAAGLLGLQFLARRRRRS